MTRDSKINLSGYGPTFHIRKVIRRFSLNEAPLGLYEFISDYFPYFEKINIFFNIAKKV
jgi:hypothetical protein